jgi:hypothetical protein
MNKRIKINRVLWVLVLFSFISGLFFIPQSPTETDSIHYAKQVKQFSSGEYKPSSFAYHKPVFIMLAGVVYWFFGVGELFALSFIQLLFGSLSIPLMFYFVRYLTKKDDVALIAASFITFAPLMLWFKVLPLTEVISLFFILAAFVLLFRYDEKGFVWYIVGAMFVFGTSLLVRSSNLFFVPVFYGTALYLLYRQKKLKLLWTFIVGVVPVVGYMLLSRFIFYPELGFGVFFGKSAQHLGSIANLFNIQLWIAHAFYIVNGFGAVGAVALGYGLYCIIKKNGKEKIELISLILLWSVPYIAYSTAIASPIARYEINILPILCLVAAFGVGKIKGFYILGIAALFDILVNYLPVSYYYYGGSAGEVFRQFFDFVNWSYVLGSILFIILMVWWLKSTKVSSKVTISSFIVVVMVIHSIPMLFLVDSRMHYMDAIGQEFGKKGNSLIVAGQEASFDRYYGNSEVIEYRGVFFKYSVESDSDEEKERVFEKVRDTLEDGKKVYTSDDHYVRSLVDDLRKEFNVEKVMIISAANVRNQFDPVAAFANYAGSKKAEDITIYEIS